MSVYFFKFCDCSRTHGPPSRRRHAQKKYFSSSQMNISLLLRTSSTLSSSSSSIINRSSPSLTQITRGAKYNIRTHPTPPTWYQRHALMYGRYQLFTPLPKQNKYTDGVKGKGEPRHKTQLETLKSRKRQVVLNKDGSHKMHLTSLPLAHQCTVFDRLLFSPSLNKRLRVKVSAEALKMIDEMGGLDVYLMRTSMRVLCGYGEGRGAEGSLAFALKSLILRRVDEINVEQNGGEIFEEEDGEEEGEERGKRGIVYRSGEGEYTWRHGLSPDFWQNKII